MTTNPPLPFLIPVKSILQTDSGFMHGDAYTKESTEKYKQALANRLDNIHIMLIDTRYEVRRNGRIELLDIVRELRGQK